MVSYKSFPKSGDVWKVKDSAGASIEVKVVSMKNNVVEYLKGEKKYEPLDIFMKTYVFESEVPPINVKAKIEDIPVWQMILIIFFLFVLIIILLAAPNTFDMAEMARTGLTYELPKWVMFFMPSSI